jgi:carbon monoxide dehydrogenase subunit G
VLAVLCDPARFVPALPNVDEFGWEDTGAGTFTAVIRPAIALGEVPFRTRWSMTRPDEGAVHYAMEGRSDEHVLQMRVRLVVVGDGGESVVTWVADYAVSGTMRAVGQRVTTAIVAAQASAVLQAVGVQARGGSRS